MAFRSSMRPRLWALLLIPLGSLLAVFWFVSRNPSSARSTFAMERRGPLELTVSSGDRAVFQLEKGYLARFRSDTSNEHWIGTQKHLLNLAWSSNQFPLAAVDQVTADPASAGFRIEIRGRKPDLFDATFETVVQADRLETDGPLTYRISSRLKVDSPASMRAKLKRKRIEFLDPWLEGIFWPARDGHRRELYETFAFRTRDGELLSAPKLHVFPSMRGRTYETLVQPLGESSFFAVLDGEAPGYKFEIVRVSARCEVGVCWWTWDPHFQVDLPAEASEVYYEVRIEPLSPAAGRMLLAAAKEVPFREDADYQLPVFYRDRTNTFRKLVDRSDEWTWEPHSDECEIDRRVGYDDTQSLTIKNSTGRPTAWYTRAFGSDYFDHRPPEGSYLVRAQVRTEGVSGEVRVGVVSYKGAESRLYAEPSPSAEYSRPLGGTQSWTPLELVFDAAPRKRFKLVLEQSGRGQSWFDNVQISPIAPGDPRLPPRIWPANTRRFDLKSSTLEVSDPRIRGGDRKLGLAWQGSWVRAPSVRLVPGRYSLAFDASATGCANDPPVLLVQVGDAASRRLAVTTSGVERYALEFDLAGERSLRPALTFLNDGQCREGGKSIDKNVFVQSLWLERHDPPATEASLAR